MITVSEVMTGNVATLWQYDTVDKACMLMAKGSFRHIPVLDNSDRLVGIVSHRDLLRFGMSHFIESHADRQTKLDKRICLKEIMTKPVKTVHPNDSLRHCGLLLQKHRFGCLPVVRNQRLVGIVTDTDFVAIAINLIELQDVTEEASGY